MHFYLRLKGSKFYVLFNIYKSIKSTSVSHITFFSKHLCINPFYPSTDMPSKEHQLSRDRGKGDAHAPKKNERKNRREMLTINITITALAIKLEMMMMLGTLVINITIVALATPLMMHRMHDCGFQLEKVTLRRARAYRAIRQSVVLSSSLRLSIVTLLYGMYPSPSV
jgi:hypothetical protein